MAIIVNCPVCPESRAYMQIRCDGNVNVKGIMQCNLCKHEMPFSIRADQLEKLDTEIPGAQSQHLESVVPDDIKEDVREAERANYSQCYKACVAMCRRALQISLIEKGVEDKPLGQMIDEARKKGLLDEKEYNLATSIKGYGDIGVHRREDLNQEDANIAIYTTVKMLNSVFVKRNGS
ncbi:DUF4145 domain-containing protein [Chloroflexota bacterium]